MQNRQTPAAAAFHDVQTVVANTAAPSDSGLLDIPTAESWDRAVELAANYLQRFPNARIIARISTSGDEQTPSIAGLNAPLDDGSELRQQLLLHGIRACQTDEITARRLTGTHPAQVISARIRQTADSTESLVILLEDNAPAATLTSAVQQVLQALQMWLTHESVRDVNHRLESAAILVELLTGMEAADSFLAAARSLAKKTASHFNARVFITTYREGTADVIANCDPSHEPTDEDCEAIEAAVVESILRESTAIYPAPERSQRMALLANKRLAEHFECAAVISSPLTTRDGQIQAGWCFLLHEAIADASAELPAFVSAAQEPVAAAFKLLHRAEPGRLQSLARTLEGPANPGRKRVAMWLATFAICALIFPMKYSVNCAVQLEPVARRFVSVPFDSPLQQSHVEPGDLVAKGQLIAELDGRDIRLKLQEVMAEKARAAQERDGHRARGDYAASRLADFDFRKHAAREELFRKQIQDLQVRSPIDGLVIAGDWKKQEGSPLEQGQSLFEIAPLDVMVVEVAIPEFDISMIEPGQDVSVTLEANTQRTYCGQMKTVHPRAELRDNENVFIAELKLPNTEDILRPGMRGRAQIRTVTRPLAWNIFRKPWLRFVEWLRYAI